MQRAECGRAQLEASRQVCLSDGPPSFPAHPLQGYASVRAAGGFPHMLILNVAMVMSSGAATLPPGSSIRASAADFGPTSRTPELFACQGLTGNQDASIAGGVAGSIILVTTLCLAIAGIHRIRKLSVAAPGHAERGYEGWRWPPFGQGGSWAAFLLVSAALFFFILAVGGSPLFDLGGAAGFVQIDPTRDGDQGAVWAAGLMGGSSLGAALVAGLAAFDCMKRATTVRGAALARGLLVLSWALFLLAQATRFLGYVHTLHIPSGPRCESDANDAAIVMNGVGGSFSIVAWVASTAAGVLAIRAHFAVEETDAEPERAAVAGSVARAITHAGVGFVLGGAYLQDMCASFFAVSFIGLKRGGTLSASAARAQYAVPGMWLLIAAIVLLGGTTRLRESDMRHVRHKAAISASLAVTGFSIAVWAFQNAAAVDVDGVDWLMQVSSQAAGVAGDGASSYKRYRGVAYFLMVVQLVAFIMSLAPYAHVASRNAARDDGALWNVVLGCWSCFVFYTMVFFGHQGVVRRASDERSLAALQDAAAAVTGGTALVGVVLTLFAAFLALQDSDTSDAEDGEYTTTTTEVYNPPAFSRPNGKYTQQPRYDPATGLPTYLADDDDDGTITKYIKVTLAGDGGNRPKGDSTINRYG